MLGLGLRAPRLRVEGSKASCLGLRAFLGLLGVSGLGLGFGVFRGLGFANLSSRTLGIPGIPGWEAAGWNSARDGLGFRV